MGEDFFQKIKEGVSLKEHNTMKIDCRPRFFVKIEDEDDLKDALNFAKQKNIPFFVLGGGSNVVFPKIYDGLVVYIGKTDFQVDSSKEGPVKVTAFSGAKLPDVAEKVTEAGGEGLEWGGGVPGTIGGAVRGNAGAFDSFIGDYVKSVEAFNVDTKEKKFFQAKECDFTYRNSFFKKNKDYIIWKVEMEFPFTNQENKKFDEYLDYRKKNHPEEPSAGSIFENPRVGEDFFSSFPEMEKFRELGFIPARYLIEDCGLKGKMECGAKISEKHPNFIINSNNASGNGIEILIREVKKRVKEKYGIDMKEEVEIVK